MFGTIICLLFTILLPILSLGPNNSPLFIACKFTLLEILSLGPRFSLLFMACKFTLLEILSLGPKFSLLFINSLLIPSLSLSE